MAFPLTRTGDELFFLGFDLTIYEKLIRQRFEEVVGYSHEHEGPYEGPFEVLVKDRLFTPRLEAYRWKSKIFPGEWRGRTTGQMWILPSGRSIGYLRLRD